MPLHYVVPMREMTIPAQEIKQPPRKLKQREGSLSDRGLIKWFNDRLRGILEQAELPFSNLEEIRLRANQPLLVSFTNRDVFLNAQGEGVEPNRAYRVMPEDLSETLERLTQSSIYAAQDEIRQGFLTIPGGHRVGITGEVVIQQGKVQTLKHITGLNFRIAKEAKGLGLDLLPFILTKEGRVCHTLILSVPRAGKTTLLRSLIRLFSDGVPELNLNGQNVGVVDERGELAGMWQGVPAFNLGVRTDILDGCPKAVGMGMLIRAMAPQVIAVDELGQEEDVQALTEALRSGVSLLCTAHASSVAEARARPSLQRLLAVGVFERIVVLSRRAGPGTVESVVDLSNGQNLLEVGGR